MKKVANTKKSLLKTLIIGGVAGLVVGGYVLIGIYFLYGFTSRLSHQGFLSEILYYIFFIITAIAMILFRISGFIIGIFLKVMPTHYNLTIILTWFFIGILLAIVVLPLIKIIIKSIIKAINKIHQTLSKIGPRI